MHALRRLFLGFIVLAILAAPIAAVLNGWIGGKHWPMKRMNVSAPFHFVSPSKVRQIVAPYLKNGFFAVDLGKIDQELSRQHWVEQVEVRKQWPDTLIVQIKEYRPVGLWNTKQLLAEEGSVFARPNYALPLMPQFNGQEAESKDILQFYKKTKPMFQAVGLSIKNISLSERNAWRVELSDGMVVEVGRNDVEQRLKRFIRFLPKIKSEDTRQLVHVDLRYTNGFALVWQAKPIQDTTQTMPTNTNGQAAI
jgi:cell division protein FtsQ